MLAPRPGSPEAAAVAWERVDAVPAVDSPGRARVRGAVQAGVGFAIGGLLYLVFGLRTLPYVMFAAAGVILLSSLLSPGGLYRALELGLGAVAARLGRAIMWVSLASIFYLFFTPFGLLFRRGRRDRLDRRFEPDKESYWNWQPDQGPRAASTSLENQY